ncbi:MAG: hypothetical protein H8E90_04890 [Anaerolineales bacterium]|nr:hypothetical protein [Anaerolineales bacterium]
MSKFTQLLESSVIFQGVLVIMIAGTYCYMVATGQQVPDALLALLQVIVGFFFGAKAAVNSRRELKKYLQDLGMERRQEQ